MKLTCEQLRELLTDHHAGELVIEQHESFQAHLEVCQDCMYYAESYTHTVKIVRRLPRWEMPKETESRLLAALKECQGEK